LSFYRDHILPRCVNKGMSGDEFRRLRAEHLVRARGRVLELGFGSGLNLPHYPEAVTELLGVDPARVGRKLAAERIAAAPFPVRFLDLDENGRLPLEDASIDTAASTWTLCTIPDVASALAEVRRVLVPGGELCFLEHGLSPDPGVARWQGRLNGIQKLLFGGCRLNRKIDDIVRAAGFELSEPKQFLMSGPRTHSSLYAGSGVKCT